MSIEKAANIVALESMLVLGQMLKDQDYDKKK
jgi:stalled ribosome rescue protein Dom34